MQKLPSKNRKNNRVSVRFDDEIFQRFCELKARTDLNNTKLLTELINSADAVTLKTNSDSKDETLKKATKALAARKSVIYLQSNIAKNLNQITHALNIIKNSVATRNNSELNANLINTYKIFAVLLNTYQASNNLIANYAKIDQNNFKNLKKEDLLK